MTLASDKFSTGDFNDDTNVPKTISRFWNLYEVQRSNMACDLEGRLCVDILDLAGWQAPMFQLLRQENVLAPPHLYHGVDYNERNIRENRRFFSEEPNAHWYAKSLARVLRNKRQTLRNVGVINYDTCGLTRGKQWEEDLEALHSFVEYQRRQLGGFVLIINAGVWRGATEEELLESLTQLYGRPIDPNWIYWYRGESIDENGKTHQHSKRANVVLHYRGASQNGLTLEDTRRKLRELFGESFGESTRATG